MPSTPGFLHFEITVTKEGDDLYAQVNRSPAGPTPKLKLGTSYASIDARTRLLTLNVAENDLGRRGEGLFVSREEKVFRDFGETMFNTVFRDEREISNRFSASLLKAADETVSGLCVKLRIESPELETLPWEYVYDAAERRYLCLRNKTPVVRFLDLPPVGPSGPARGRLNVLGMIANPGNSEWEELDADEERGRIEKALRELDPEAEVNFRWVQGGTPEHLLDMIHRAPWHIFHFIGHGGTRVVSSQDGKTHSEGYLVFEDGRGGAVKVSSSQLEDVLQGNSLRLVVLNCCETASTLGADAFGSTGAALVRSGVPAVVAMQFAISDEAAIQFSRQFYGSLAGGLPLEIALTNARVSMKLRGSLEWGVPVLFTRAPNGDIFARDGDGNVHEQPARRAQSRERTPPRFSAQPELEAQEKLRELFEQG